VNTNFSAPKGKSGSTWRLFRGKSTNALDKMDSNDSNGVKQKTQPQLAVPLVEALFLPDFPVKSQDTDFDVSRKMIVLLLLCIVLLLYFQYYRKMHS